MASSWQVQKELLIAGYCRIESNDMNIINGIILIIFEYHKCAKWSNENKGMALELSEDDAKVTCIKEDIDTTGNSVRADFAINRGDMVSWELECKITHYPCNFMGVVTSKVTNFDINPSFGMEHAYGIDDAQNTTFNGNGHEEYVTNWNKPRFPVNEVFMIKIIADWTQKQCKLTFFYNEKRLNDKDENCTIKLPELDNNVVIYPCVTPYNEGAYFVIRYC